MKFRVWVELERVSGPEQDVETMLDAFAGTIGRDNAAKPPLRVTTSSGEEISVYEVKLVDDRA